MFSFIAVHFYPDTPLAHVYGHAPRTCAHSDWVLHIDELEAAFTPRTKLFVLNTPHNPTGKVFSEAELLRISELVCALPCMALPNPSHRCVLQAKAAWLVHTGRGSIHMQVYR